MIENVVKRNEFEVSGWEGKKVEVIWMQLKLEWPLVITITHTVNKYHLFIFSSHTFSNLYFHTTFSELTFEFDLLVYGNFSSKIHLDSKNTFNFKLYK